MLRRSRRVIASCVSLNMLRIFQARAQANKWLISPVKTSSSEWVSGAPTAYLLTLRQATRFRPSVCFHTNSLGPGLSTDAGGSTSDFRHLLSPPYGLGRGPLSISHTKARGCRSGSVGAPHLSYSVPTWGVKQRFDKTVLLASLCGDRTFSTQRSYQ